MPTDPYQLAFDHMVTSDWLMKECDEVTERYYAIEKKLRKIEENYGTPDIEDIEEMEKVHRHMRELENRFMFEERQYSKILKKLDDLDEF